MSKADTAAKVARVRELMSRGMSERAAVVSARIPRSTYRNAVAAERGASAPPESVKQEDDGSSTLSGGAPSPESLMRKHNFDPEEYEIISARMSEYGDPNDPMFQLRINVMRKDGMLRVPDPARWEPLLFAGVEEFSNGSVLFLPDLHAPYHDRALQMAIMSYIIAEQPQLIINLGDQGDWGNISKHRSHPDFNAAANEITDAVAHDFYLQRVAAPDAEIIFIPGNHDDRLMYAILDKVPELAGLRPGRLPTDDEQPSPAAGYRTLYRLDDLGVELVDEEWKLAKYPVTPSLTARHGYLTGPNSEKKMLDKHVKSQVHGHTHSAGVTYRTKHDPLETRVSMDCGTRSEVTDRGLGYAPDPDWHQGVGIGHVWDDDKFVLAFAPFIDNELLVPGGRRFTIEGEI